MKPIDFRNAAFADLRGQLAGRLEEVYRAWVTHGPGTTRQLSQKSGIDILTLRPRTTDLFDLGLVTLCGSEGHEGIYRAALQPEWEAWSNAQREGRVGTQVQLL